MNAFSTAGSPSPKVELVMDALLIQISEAEHQGLSQHRLAEAIIQILDGNDYSVGENDVVAYRMAWLLSVYAPAYDPVLVATLPFCLDGIVEGFASFEELFSHILEADPPSFALELPSELLNDLPSTPLSKLRPVVVKAVATLKTDPQVLERIIDRMDQDDLDSERSSGIRWSQSFSKGSVVSRWPPSIRDALVSLLEMEPAPRAVPLMKQITERLDPRSVHRLASELVHLSFDASTLRVRARAAASLLALGTSKNDLENHEMPTLPGKESRQL